MTENSTTSWKSNGSSPLKGPGEVKGFSFSSLSTFKSCPKAFEFRYIKKIPEAFNSIEAHMGSSVHEALEWAYKQKGEDHDPTLDQVLEQYGQYWQAGDFETIKIVKEDKKREDYYNIGRECLIYYINEVFPWDRSTTLFLEQRFQIPMGDDIVYRGIIDRIAKEEDGTIRVTDYKTGKVGHPLDTLQLPSYALYIFQHNIDQEIELCYEDLRQRKSVTVRYNRKEVRKIKEALQAEIETIRNAPPDSFVAKPSVLCLWCGFNQICDNPDARVKRRQNGHSRENANQTGVTSGDLQGGCPQCGGDLRERKGKFGNFLGCTNYPECRYTRDVGANPGNNSGRSDDPVLDAATEGKDICPECGSILKQRKGKFGAFMGCSSFPQCRFTREVS